MNEKQFENEKERYAFIIAILIIRLVFFVIIVLLTSLRYGVFYFVFVELISRKLYKAIKMVI